MKALVFPAVGQAELRDVPSPAPGPGEALLSVRASGLCAGDLYIYTGKNPYVTYPRVGCHEVSGVVVALGPDTQGPAPGSRVVVDPFIGCGTCYPCRIGKRNCCARLTIIGVHRDGGFADLMVAPVGNLVPIPPDLSDYHAAFAEPVAIGIQGCRRGAVAAGETVLILGAGPIGLALVEVVRARKAHPVVTDIDPRRLAIAGSLGAETIAAGPNLVEEVLRRTDGEGMPVVMEATGNARVMEQCIDLVAAGGRIVILGLVARGTGVTWPGLDFTRKEVTILGSRASVDCFPEALDLLASGRISYPSIAETFALDAAPEVFRRLAEDPMCLQKAVFVAGAASG